MTMVFFWKLTYKINVKFLEITNLKLVYKYRVFSVLKCFFREPFYLGNFGKGVAVYVIRCKMQNRSAIRDPIHVQ